MNIKPIYTEVDYQEVLAELMAYEAQGMLAPDELFYIEVMTDLLEAFKTKHDPRHWDLLCYK
ncbi:MAG: hypothetical protein K0R66_1425 [Gammaproteobacteria bacterium]|jgi:hypothetical protein|nr:hypothetical protein [Gammaproteobacteria bacterium]